MTKQEQKQRLDLLLRVASMKDSSKSRKKKRVREYKEQEKKKPIAYLKHRLFVPTHLVTQEMRDAYVDIIPDFYDPFDEYGEERLDRNLYIHGWHEHRKGNYGGYTSFARGDVGKYKETFRRFEIVDKTADVALKHDIKFIGVPDEKDSSIVYPLRPSQKKTAKKMFRLGYGIMKAPPRFGKTTWMTYVVTKYKRRTIVFVHQIDLARQFEAEFRKCTNTDELEKRSGKKIIGIARKWSDLETLDIAIVTWQRFHAGTGGKAAVKRFRNAFGLTLIDEGHRFSSKFSSKVVGSFNTRFRIAVTATPERKDQQDAIIKQIVGPVTVVGKTKQVPLRVMPYSTGFAPKFARWTTYMKHISESKRRNKLCLDMVEKQVRAGHYVLVVCVLRKHIVGLTKDMNDRGITSESFYGGVKNRDSILARAKSGLTKVIFGMRSMLTGVNIPRWDVIHILSPTSNAPNHYQEFSRVRTPTQGKETALVVDYIDNTGAGRGCYKVRHGNYIDPEFAPVSFVDKNSNIFKKQPSLKTILEWSMSGPLGGAKTEKQNGFMPLFGFSHARKKRIFRDED